MFKASALFALCNRLSELFSVKKLFKILLMFSVSLANLATIGDIDCHQA